LVLVTLTIGIIIGTLIRTDALAQKAATDATPLKIPSPVELANDFTALAKKMEPTVVHITTDFTPKQTSASRRRPGGEEGAEEGDEMDLFRRFFGGPGTPFGDAPRGQSPRAFRREATGSGFLVDPKGYIITNHHVVEGADSIKVKLHGDQTDYKAKLIGFDVETDLAVIKIDAGRALPYAKVGNSDAVQVGDWAVAIGSPFGLDASVTAGIISAKGRDVAQQFQRFIQTDAAINPGNSGGPLLNIRGDVIGVNTAIATQSGGYQGIGFALPVNMAVKVYNQIIQHGRVTRGSIGISWQRGQERPELLKALGIDHGVIVEQVTEGGPADKAGIKPEDVIVGINGKPVKDGEDLVSRVADTPVGDKLNVTVDRNGKKLDLAVVVGDRMEVFKDDPRFARLRQNEEPEKEEPQEAKFGLYVRNLSQQEIDKHKIEDSKGVKVTRVMEESFAAEVGIQEGDVILSINRQPVSSVEDIRKVQGTLKPGDAVAFRILRPNPFAGRPGQQPHAVFFLTGTLPRN
jgi:serine protease Do